MSNKKEDNGGCEIIFFVFQAIIFISCLLVGPHIESGVMSAIIDLTTFISLLVLFMCIMIFLGDHGFF